MDVRGGAPHVTTPRRSRSGPRGLRLHRARRLDETDIAVVHGIPVTSLPRTLVDLTDLLDVRSLARIVREAQFRGLLVLPEVDAALARAHGRRRLARLRTVLDTHRPADVIRSELEQRFHELCRDAALPRPETNVEVAIGARVWEVDCLWRAQGVVVELDGAAAHDNPRAFEADRERDAALIAAGLRPLRITWRRLIRRPDDVARELRAILARSSPKP
jgi:very-short-patch-repair endonuclease